MPYTSDCPEEFGQIGNCLTAINSNHEEVEFKKDHSKVQEFIGGNAIDVALPSPVADFVRRKGGHTVITKILIANNGIAAVKEIRSVQKWAHKTFVPGGSNNNNYANVNVIVDVAKRAGVHAVWAGWGHASENPQLPDALSAMRSLGEKISSTIVAQSAQVPTMAWSGSSLSETKTSPQGYLTVANEVYKKACVTDLGEVPGSPIFIMKLAGAARHLEVQVVAEQNGNAISLFGRDCSVQRHYQKIIEEAPVTIAHPETFKQMEKAAVRLAKLLNPRLQIKHPTAEMVSGVNLPAAQLQIVMGIPLHQIRDIQTVWQNPYDNSQIDFDFNLPQSPDTQCKPMPKGHVVAVRITAENPDAGFKPSSGTLQELNFRSSTNVWGYFSVGTAGGLHEFTDSQFGHIFAHGADRSKSRKAMIVALKELSIRGDFRTTVKYLIKLLETEAFESNTITTSWLDTLI
ncbi:hypothetical protein PCASD_18464 [Puccinia coronata f. sp. avenae]|uniref:Biotin carboxylation domain-containing protein n=1 Tax=Puccinia coronata f. sp. avenae TaxID=200324 RepID=A0A2N5U2S0_9BASI|nr:hypothetical protein PCASD_18464 [Puccinia coronata f. sp. avenae]